MWVARPKYDILSQKTLSGHYLKERIAPDDHKWLCNYKLYNLKKESSPYTHANLTPSTCYSQLPVF
jgi:hypothetical protein